MATLLIYGVPLDPATIGVHRPDDPQEGPAWLAHSRHAQDGVHLRSYEAGAIGERQQGYLLALNGPQRAPYPWGPQRLTPKHFAVGRDWNRTLRAYCRRWRLGTAGLPGWHMLREHG